VVQVDPHHSAVPILSLASESRLRYLSPGSLSSGRWEKRCGPACEARRRSHPAQFAGHGRPDHHAKGRSPSEANSGRALQQRNERPDLFLGEGGFKNTCSTKSWFVEFVVEFVYRLWFNLSVPWYGKGRDTNYLCRGHVPGGRLGPARALGSGCRGGRDVPAAPLTSHLSGRAHAPFPRPQACKQPLDDCMGLAADVLCGAWCASAGRPPHAGARVGPLHG